jgi:hypothetical protein
VWFEATHEQKAVTMHDSKIFGPCMAGKRPINEISMTAFEQFLIVNMYFHTDLEQHGLSRIWGVAPRSIGRYIATWAPIIGQAGKDVSILNINEAWIDYEQPAVYDEVDMQDVGAVVDGKDYGCDTIRAHSLAKKLCWSDKTSGSAARCLTFSAKCGLVFDTSGLYCGRVSETAILKAMGSVTEEIPLATWGPGWVDVPELPPPLPGSLPALERLMSKGVRKSDVDGDEKEGDADAAVDVKPELLVIKSARSGTAPARRHGKRTRRQEESILSQPPASLPLNMPTSTTIL